MKKQLLSLLVAGTLAPAAASAGFLQNWYMDADKDGSLVQVSEYLDITGNSYVENTFVNPTDFTFTDEGFFQITGNNGGAALTSLADANDSVIPSVQLTAMFENGTGFGSLSGGISFTGGDLELFADPVYDYGTAAGIFGANQGDSLGTFSLYSGGGFVDASGVPNGLLTFIFEATSLDVGVFFDENMNDLSTMIDPLNPILFGFVTTNASVVADNTGNTQYDLLVAELAELGLPVTNTAPTNFVISNNGQYRFSVPEPSSLALLGLGLLGFGLRGKRKGA